MPLGTDEPLSHPAIIANENLFSHAKLVLRECLTLAKLVFTPARMAPPNPGQADRLKKDVLSLKKLPSDIPTPTIAVESGSFHLLL
jgi:hypothetical protein